MSNFYYLLGEDAGDEVTLIAESRFKECIEKELCKEAEKGNFKNLRTFHLTNDGRYDDRMYMTRSEWRAVNEF